jgi:hypothetical protein
VAVIYLEYHGDHVELPLGETVVGRDIGCSLRFNDRAVSRRHLRFVRKADVVFVEDLDSSNGTLVNGERVTGSTRVHDGDEIAIGGRTMVVRMQVAPVPEPITLSLGDVSDSRDSAPPRDWTTAVSPTAGSQQRCPRCGAQVNATDDACGTCEYEWGEFRPMTPTLQGANPLSRRRHERASLELHLVYVSSELEIEATTRDLSVSGVFVCSKILDPIGTPCLLTILIDGGPPLSLRGIVRRVVANGSDEPEGLGIEFVDITPADLTWLRNQLGHGDPTAPFSTMPREPS